MISKIKKLFGVKTPPPADDTDVESFNKGVFPCCGSVGGGFLEGPSSGLCTNIECAQCHTRWNICMFSAGVFHAERI